MLAVILLIALSSGSHAPGRSVAGGLRGASPDPPAAIVLLPGATVSGPAVALPTSSVVRGAAVALADGRIALLDLAEPRVVHTIPLPAAPVGGLAAAALATGGGFGMFVATVDGGISAFTEEGELLQGFPVSGTAGNTPGAMPALGDLDGDGALEVVWGGSDGKVWAWAVDGRFIPGFPKVVGDAGPNVQVALTDLDDHPGVEIVAVTDEGVVNVFGAGGVLAGWPQATAAHPHAPSITRFGDGAQPTILIAAGTTTFAFAADGALRWARVLDSVADSEPVPGDLDGDGIDEVIVSRTAVSELSVLNSLGVPVNFGAWPKRSPSAPRGTPLLGHVSRSGSPAVLWTVPESGVFAYDAATAVLPGFPKPGGTAWAGSIADFDGDGRTEILGGAADGPGTYMYRLEPGTWRLTPQAWPTPRGNFARTGSRLYAPGVDQDTPVLISLVAARAEPGVVHLTWRSTGDLITTAVIERRPSGGAWRAIATIARDIQSEMRYEDRDVRAGEGYGYRLAVTVRGSVVHFGEIEIEIPRLMRFALAGARPNPAPDGLRIAFDLPDASPARLEAIDLAGRRCWSSEVGARGSGQHVLAVPVRLAPGVYVLRLARRGAELTTRCAVIR